VRIELVNTEASDDCEAAQEAVEKANRELAEAEEEYHRYDEAYHDDVYGRGHQDIEVGFAACVFTSGFFGVLSGNPVVPFLGLVGCVGYFGYQEWELAEKTEEDRKAMDAAFELRAEADRALRQAQKARDKSCHMVASCGSRGGRGFRRPDGKCAGWDDWGYA
jgi:hypothetical protein